MVKLALLLSVVTAYAAISFGQDVPYITVYKTVFKLFKNGLPKEKDLGNVLKIFSSINQKNILQIVLNVFLHNGNSSTFENGVEDGSNNFPDMTEILEWVSKLSKYRYVLDSFLDSGNLTEMSSRISEKISSNIPGFQQSDETQNINSNLIQLYDKFKDSPMTEKCTMDGLLLFNGIINFEMWALKMVDSMGKIPVGILDGNLKSLGAFDQCLSIKLLGDNSEQKSQSPINGKYCTIQIPLNSLVGSLSEAPGAADAVFDAAFARFVLGLCIPFTCSEAELIYIVNEVLSNITIQNSTFKAVRPNCRDEHREYPSEAIAAFCLSGFIILLMVIGTTYDIIYIQMPKQKEHSQQNGYAESDYKSENCNGAEKSIDVTRRIQCKTNEPGLAGKLVASFSVYTNGKKLLNTNQSSGTITAMNGIRFISMTWVILGHAYSSVLFNGQNIASYSNDLINRWTFNAIGNALISVDTFFTMSGLLVSYLILKEMKKNKGACGINWGLFYFHRIWRLTPVYILVLFVYVTTFQYWGDGPFYPQESLDPEQCNNYWWTNLLYVNNLVHPDKMCFGWSWYLANDMQFYVISPLLLIPLFYNEIIGIGVCVLFLIATTVAAGVVSIRNKLPPSTFGGGEKGSADHDTYSMEYYFKPWCRMGPYIVGILAGYLLYKTNCKLRITKYVNIALWLLTTAIGLAILYGLYDALRGKNPLTVQVSAFYNATHRSAWGFCVCWVIVSCATGHGGYINTLLSWRPFIPLSRLTYCAYLVHPIIMYYYYYSARQPLYLTDISMILLFFGFLVASYLVAFVVSLAFESPMMGLEKIMFGRGSK